MALFTVSDRAVELVDVEATELVADVEKRCCSDYLCPFDH